MSDDQMAQAYVAYDEAWRRAKTQRHSMMRFPHHYPEPERVKAEWRLDDNAEVRRRAWYAFRVVSFVGGGVERRGVK